MKNILKVITLLFTVSLIAQSHEIIKHNGTKLEVNYIKAEYNLIYYSVPSNMVEQKISKYAVAQLNDKLKSSSEIISEKNQLIQQSDYRKVIILKEFETVGLKRSEEITSFIGKVKGQTNYELKKLKENNLQRKAAMKGAPFIVLISTDPENLKAVTYTY